MSNASVHIPSSQAEERRGIGSRFGWSGMVETPDGIASLSLGSVGVPTALTNVEGADPWEDRSAGGRERSFDGQLLLANYDEFSLSVNQSTGAFGISALVEGLADSAFVTNQVGGDDDTTLSSDGHAVQTPDNTQLLSGQQTPFSNVIVDGEISYHTPVGNGGAFVDEGAIAVSDNDLRNHLASCGGDRTLADREVFKLQQVALEPLVTMDGFRNEGAGLIEPMFFVKGAAGLGKNER
jgi:hypothetical protein